MVRAESLNGLPFTEEAFLAFVAFSAILALLDRSNGDVDASGADLANAELL
jgi:hypothetical protein